MTPRQLRDAANGPWEPVDLADPRCTFPNCDEVTKFGDDDPPLCEDHDEAARQYIYEQVERHWSAIPDGDHWKRWWDSLPEEERKRLRDNPGPFVDD